MNIIHRNNVRIQGSGSQNLIFSHGYGCDQNVWKELVPSFEKDYRVILFDHVGSGESDLSMYDRVKYGTLHGYAEDVLELCERLEISDAVFVGHSVSATIGALACRKEPGRFKNLIMMAPTPSFINAESYIGGFERTEINDMLATLDDHYVEWAQAIAPLIMGTGNDPALTQLLLESFCRTKPEIAKHFAQVVFLADHRGDMAEVPVPTLVLQCSKDSLAPESVGQFLQKTIPKNHFVKLNATGHCPHMSAAQEVTQVIRNWLSGGHVSKN